MSFFRSGLRTGRIYFLNSSRPARLSRSIYTYASVGLFTSVVLYSGSRVVHNDTQLPAPESDRKQNTPLFYPEDDLETIVWGSNKFGCLIPDASSEQTGDFIRTPGVARWLENVALKDLCIHERYAACVDARGDVYQWGEAFFGTLASPNKRPTLTLRGKNIVRLQLSGDRVFALSASGNIYVLSAKNTSRGRTHSTWWPFEKQEKSADFVELVPKQAINWREKFVSISAGNDHLLALTSSGRAFAHPINKRANLLGQLGFKIIEVTDPSSDTTITTELIPRPVADPYARITAYGRPVSPANVAEPTNISHINDRDIRFCPYLFEIPALQGLKVKQLCAGARHSLALLESGRILGWGANEYGQLGLGDLVLEAIPVPTEIVLGRNTRGILRCFEIAAGGDLTSFVVQRLDKNPTVVEILMCGNGQWGGLGNNVFSNSQSIPIRARNVSGLTEFNDAKKGLQAIAPHALAISSTGHVLLTLDTPVKKDLYVWGKNHDSELGNGKKSSVPIPTSLITPDGEKFLLHQRVAKKVLDLGNQLWKKNVTVSQVAVAGPGNSVVYWKIR